MTEDIGVNLHADKSRHTVSIKGSKENVELAKKRLDQFANGGDGYSMFEGDDKNAYDFGPDLADVTAEYLAANAPYTPYVDGRIKQK